MVRLLLFKHVVTWKKMVLSGLGVTVDSRTSSRSPGCKMFVFDTKQFFALSIFISSVSLNPGNDDRSFESMRLYQNNRKMKIIETAIINTMKITVFHRKAIFELLFTASLTNNTGFMEVLNVNWIR